MGQLINFCAGAERPVLPARRVNAMLLNVPDNAESDTAIKATQDMLVAAQPKVVMLDSGGYPLHVAELNSRTITFDPNSPVFRDDTRINLAPIHVMEAAAVLKPDIVVGLDFPIKKELEHHAQQIEFMRKLGFNAIWARECYALKRKLCPDVRFFLPIQCYDLRQLEQFMNLIIGVEFDGVSMPIRNLGIPQIIAFLVRFYQMGIRQVHILGTSKIAVIAVSAYMARHFFDWVSFDATTWRQWAEYALYMNPHDLKQTRIAPDVIIDENIKIDCKCPFCRGRTFTHIKNLPDTDRTAFLRGHNWWVIEKATQDLSQNSGNVMQLKRCLQMRGIDAQEIDTLSMALARADALKNGDIKLLSDLFD